MTNARSLQATCTADETAPPGADARARRPWSAVAVVLMLAPALAAVWTVPWFVTQDGLAHLYNARILVDALRGGPAFGETYQVRWDPLPNWGGHLTLMGLVAAFPPRVADRIMTSITLVGLAYAAVWLRGRVEGSRPSLAATALAALAGMSFSWLMGFASFQLGACLFALTLGVWWKGRDDLRPGRMAAIGGLLVAGYFCHLVSVGLTIFALGFLAVACPGPGRDDFWKARAGKLAVCVSPLLLLLLVYLRLARRGGAMSPVFPETEKYFTISGWMGRLGWVDPISFAVKSVLPFTERTETVFIALNPFVWLFLSGSILVLAALLQPRDRSAAAGARRAWFGLAAVLLLAGVLGPDSMGPGHGDYLPQRVALLGLVAAIPAIGPESRTSIGRVGTAAMGVALALQWVSVWDYAAHAQRTVGPIAGVAPNIGRGVRVAALLGDLETRFRVNPALHAACWLGVAGDDVVWNNYETRHYYFPVQFRTGVSGPSSYDLEDIALMGRNRRVEGVRLWEKVLATHHGAIDVLVTWRGDPDLDAATNRWFEPVEELGRVTILRPRGDR